MLEVKNLSVKYDHIAALDKVSFHVEKGTILSIIGSNGAGKSTLVNAISGLVQKTHGEILLEGTTLPCSAHKIVRRGIVQVPEGRHVFPNLTVQENLIVGGTRLPVRNATKNISKMLHLFPILGERRRQLAGTLSGGEQQMLAIARGLMSEPKILMLDEPSLGLAPKVVSQVFEIIQEINQRGITIVLIEQNANRAMAISSYTYVLENGRVVKEGPSSLLKHDRTIQETYLGVAVEET